MALFSKAHYEALSKAINQYLSERPANKTSTEGVVITITDLMAKDNHRFDRKKFLVARPVLPQRRELCRNALAVRRYPRIAVNHVSLTPRCRRWARKLTGTNTAIVWGTHRRGFRRGPPP
jgi:hypothetical protein